MTADDFVDLHWFLVEFERESQLNVDGEENNPFDSWALKQLNDHMIEDEDVFSMQLVQNNWISFHLSGHLHLSCSSKL